MRQNDELEQMSRSPFQNQEIDLSKLPAEVEAPEVPILLLEKSNPRGIWRISIALTDCYGEINLDRRGKTVPVPPRSQWHAHHWPICLAH